MTENAKPQAPRPRFGSVVDRETSRLTQLLIDSHTQILRGLSLLAPKERRSRIRWILAAGLLVVVGVLAADRSAREFAMSNGRAFYDRHKTPAAPAAAPPAAPAAPAPEPEPAATTAAVVASPGGQLQVPAAPAATVAASEPAASKDDAAPAAVQPAGARSTRAPKARGSNRPRTTPARGGT